MFQNLGTCLMDGHFRKIIPFSGKDPFPVLNFPISWKLIICIFLKMWPFKCLNLRRFILLRMFFFFFWICFFLILNLCPGKNVYGRIFPVARVAERGSCIVWNKNKKQPLFDAIANGTRVSNFLILSCHFNATEKEIPSALRMRENRNMELVLGLNFFVVSGVRMY